MKVTPNIVILALSACPIAAEQACFSEKFESGKIDPAVWDQRVTGTATIAVEETEGAHGKYALHVHLSGHGRRAATPSSSPTHLPDSVRTHFFGRGLHESDAGRGHNAQSAGFWRRARLAAVEVPGDRDVSRILDAVLSGGTKSLAGQGPRK